MHSLQRPSCDLLFTMSQQASHLVHSGRGNGVGIASWDIMRRKSALQVGLRVQQVNREGSLCFDDHLRLLGKPLKKLVRALK